MKVFKFLLVSVFCLLISAQSVQALNYKDLEQGNVDVQLIDTKEIKGLKAIAIIKAPPKKVWNTLLDYKNYPKFMPRVSQSIVKKKMGNIYHVYHKMDVPWPFPEMWYTNRCVTDSKKYTFKWQMLEGSLKNTKGSWQLKPYKKKWTLAIYSVEVDFGVPLIPSWVVNRIQSRLAPGIFQGIRKYLKVK